MAELERNIHTRVESYVSDTETLNSPTSPQPSGFSAFPPPSKPGIPSVIPPEHPYRTLVLCFDGTGDQFDNDNSNIVEFFSMLKKDDRTKQMVYYQAGIGTYISGQTATPFAAGVSKAIDTAIARSLDSHVMDGYEFLMQNYTAGDRICIFGFSRGAYTARGLAGMIHKVGLLPADNFQQVPFAYKMFSNTNESGWKQSNAFKKAFSIDVDIEFIGVWDTVNSVGLIPRRLPFTTSNTIVMTFRHAVSLDERRGKFKANLWNRPNAKERILSVTDQKIEEELKQQKANPTTPNKGKKNNGKDSLIRTQRSFENTYSKDRNKPTDIEEVWFAGAHCDIGGGSVSNDTRHSLARIALRWMIRECFKTKSGIMFHSASLRDIGINPASLYPDVLPRPPRLPTDDAAHLLKIKGTERRQNEFVALVDDPHYQSEEGQDHLDALCPIYDQLKLAWAWWILEYTPLTFRYQTKDNTWAKSLGFNRGAGRIIPRQRSNGVKVHRSVQTRMEAYKAIGQEYIPKANLNLDCVTWVD